MTTAVVITQSHHDLR